MGLIKKTDCVMVVVYGIARTSLEAGRKEANFSFVGALSIDGLGTATLFCFSLC